MKKLFSSLLFIIILLETCHADIKASTYNIKWIGYSKNRDNAGIAKMLSYGGRDLVIIQELVSPPVPVKTSTGKTIKADRESTAFFNAMEAEGYAYMLSTEDTGTGDKIHTNSAATEWFVAFYKPDKLTSIDSGFLAEDRSNHDDYERVPYYFTFKSVNGADFTIVSTHLKPGNGSDEITRRYHELSSISRWVYNKLSEGSEKDYIVLGDMNVYDCDILKKNLKGAFELANKQCLNSNLKMTEPYDQVLYLDEHTSITDYEVIDMFETFNIPIDTPNKEVISKYSDHHPVFFTIKTNGDDD